MIKRAIAAACRWRIDILSDFGGNRARQLGRATVAECTKSSQLRRVYTRQ
jgi:hypothetical protein